MNILYISNEYPPETGFGGIGTYTLQSAEGLAKRGHGVHVICRSPEGAPLTTIQNGVTVHRISPGTYPLPSWRALYPFRKFCYAQAPHVLSRLAWAREAFKEYLALSESIPFDIIEYPECGGEGYYFFKADTIARIARLHTPWEMVRCLNGTRETAIDRVLLSHIERASVRKADAVTSPTKALAKLVRQKWHIKNISVFPNPAPGTGPNMRSGNDWIFTGRVEFRKGVHLLIEAYARLCRSESPPLLRIVGKPYGRLQSGADYGDSIEKMIASHGLGKKIQWIKGVPLSSIAGLLGQSSVAIFPSLWENQSYSCLEAMSLGCAVVTSRTGGFTEIIEDGRNGLMFEPNSVDQLTEKLMSLLKDPALAHSLGAAAIKTIETVFDPLIIFDAMEKVYGSVAQGKAHGKY
jgi:glycosyltransferase involved in cell wall biosynthesis